MEEKSPVYVAPNSFWRVIGNKLRLSGNQSLFELLNTVVVRFMVLGINFIATTIITRNLSVEDRGKYAYLLNSLYLLMTFLTLGFHSSIVYILSKNRWYFSYLYTLSFILTLAAFLVLAVFSWSGLVQTLCPMFKSIDLWVLILGAPLLLFNYFNSFFFISTNDFRRYNLYEFMKNAIFLALTLVFFSFVTQYEYYLLFFITGNLIYVITSFYQFYQRGYIKVNPSHIIKNWAKFAVLFKRSFNIATISYVSCILSFVLSKYVLFFIGSYLGVDVKALGHYSVALANIDILMILPTTLAFYIFPKVSAVDCMRKKIAIVNQMILFCVLFFAAVELVSLFFLKQIFSLLYGSAYVQAASMFQWLLPSALLLSVISCISSFIGGIGMERTAIYAPLWALVFMIASSIALSSLAFDVYNFIYLQNFAYLVYFVIYIRFFLKKWKQSS